MITKKMIFCPTGWRFGGNVVLLRRNDGLGAAVRAKADAAVKRESGENPEQNPLL